MNYFDVLYICIAFFAVMCGVQVIKINNRLNIRHNKRIQRLKNKLSKTS